jgi:hypothetical protein
MAGSLAEKDPHAGTFRRENTRPGGSGPPARTYSPELFRQPDFELFRQPDFELFRQPGGSFLAFAAHINKLRPKNANQ